MHSGLHPATGKLLSPSQHSSECKADSKHGCRWFFQHGGEVPWAGSGQVPSLPGLPEPEQKRLLLERWNSHTSTCPHCSKVCLGRMTWSKFFSRSLCTLQTKPSLPGTCIQQRAEGLPRSGMQHLQHARLLPM